MIPEDEPGGAAPEPPGAAAADLLDSWKLIASYLQRDVRTVMRWERTRALPVHRLPGGRKSAVFARKNELEAWRAARPPVAEAGPGRAGTARLRGWVGAAGRRIRRSSLAGLSRARWWTVALAVVVAALLATRPRAPSREAASPSIRSLAVLPFDNLMNDPGQEYFVDGIHEALLTDLARLVPVRVISRTSVMRYRDTRKSAREIAGELDVDALVEGSVLRSEDHVRVAVQLVQGRTDAHLWASTYDREVRDVLATLLEISGAIAGEIKAKLEPGAADSAATRPVAPEAYESFLRARHASRTLTAEGLEAAVALHRRALQIDPDFAHAWAGLAGARVAQAFFGHRAAGDVLPEAREAARRALALDDQLGEAHAALGFIALYWDRDLTAAGRALERSLRLRPNDANVRHLYADYLLVQGQVEESLAQARIGRSCDPFWPTAHWIVLFHTLWARRYDEVIAEGRRMLEAFPEAHGVHESIGRAMWLQGRHEDALAEWRAARGAADPAQRALEAAYRTSGPRAALRAEAEWRAARAREGGGSAFGVAGWFAAAGASDLALEWLQRAHDRREAQLLHVVADPYFDPIRADPRFEALLRRIGVPPRAAAGTPPVGSSGPAPR